MLSLATIHAAGKVVRPGVPEVQAPMAGLTPAATIELGGGPDWMVLTDDAVWIATAG